MPRDEALVTKALQWMRRHRPSVEWSRQDADHFIRLFDAELIKRARDGRGIENRREMQRQLLMKLTPIEAPKPKRRRAPSGKPCIHGVQRFNCRYCAGPNRYTRTRYGR